jgi:DnaJ-class molecular chaperone
MRCQACQGTGHEHVCAWVCVDVPCRECNGSGYVIVPDFADSHLGICVPCETCRGFGNMIRMDNGRLVPDEWYGLSLSPMPRVNRRRPCEDCNGSGISHCCDGICEQPDIGQPNDQAIVPASKTGGSERNVDQDHDCPPISR